MAAICLSASFVLIPEQAAAKYSRYEASREAVNASASPGVNSKSLTSSTRTLATSSCGVPQQSLYFFPEPHPHGSLRPVLLLIVPSGSELYLFTTFAPFPLCSRQSIASMRKLWQIVWSFHIGRQRQRSRVLGIHLPQAEEDGPQQSVVLQVGEKCRFSNRVKKAAVFACPDQPIMEFLIIGSGMRFYACSLRYHSESRHNNRVVNCGARCPAEKAETSVFFRVEVSFLRHCTDVGIVPSCGARLVVAEEH